MLVAGTASSSRTTTLDTRSIYLFVDILENARITNERLLEDVRSVTGLGRRQLRFRLQKLMT
jgi:hypothetical protein